MRRRRRRVGEPLPPIVKSFTRDWYATGKSAGFIYDRLGVPQHTTYWWASTENWTHPRERIAPDIAPVQEATPLRRCHACEQLTRQMQCRCGVTWKRAA